jgi:hypothetical protein
MARIAAPNYQAFKVVLTEYDRFSGQKHFDTWYFDNEAEARRVAIDYNTRHNTAASAPDWYVRADYAGPVG